MGANCFCMDLMYKTKDVFMCFFVAWLHLSLNKSAFILSMYSASSLSSGLSLLLKFISGRLVRLWKSIIELLLCYHFHYNCVCAIIIVFPHCLNDVLVWQTISVLLSLFAFGHFTDVIT